MNKLIALSAAAFFAANSASLAADAIGIPAPVVPLVPVVDSSSVWDGFYAGANVGYGWGQLEETEFGETLDADGWLGGVQLGYNWALSGVVVGVEADYQYADINFSEYDDDLDLTAKLGINHFGTVRGRVGADLGNFMPYLTAGVAFGEVGLELSSGGASADATDYTWGWAAGAGVEAMLMDNVSLKAEYLYVDLRDANIEDTDLNASAHTARVGLNFHF